MLLLLKFSLFLLTFIFGMTILRFGLFNLSAHSMQNILTNLTDKAWKGLLVGTAITIVLQSSSAVMVIVIGLISARVISFRQSIGIILGTNIGTTVTTELITLNIDPFLLPLVVTGVILFLFNNKNIRSIGLILFGIGAVFIAMNGFKNTASEVMEIDTLVNTIVILKDSTTISILFGAFLTAIIQSSTALVGVAMGFLNNNAIELQTGIALMLGANIGTCATAYIASLGAGKEARLCAFAHIWLNVIGVVLFFPFINTMANYFSLIATTAAVQLAHASVLFNVISSIIVLPFAARFGQLVEKLHN